LLMPAQSLAELSLTSLDLHAVMRRRKELQVSSEALLRRLVSLTDEPATMFAARRSGDRYVVDYAEMGRAGGPAITSRTRPPAQTVLRHCTAVGQTAEATEEWSERQLLVQAVGIPAYPGHRFPRVAGIAQLPSAHHVQTVATFAEITGSALEPPSPESSIIAHVVNDRAHAWGGEFGGRLARRYPWAANAFRAWTVAAEENLHLGQIHLVEGPRDEPLICSLVAQEGFGPSLEPRLRYPALAECLDRAAAKALESDRTVHCPRFGTGHGRGHWDLVRDQIDRSLVRRGIGVTVYRLGGS
jgi:hypothetical protein